MSELYIYMTAIHGLLMKWKKNPLNQFKCGVGNGKNKLDGKSNE